MTEDESQLELLSVFHYILGGITALFACIPLLHVGIGLAMVFADFNGESPPPFFGWFFAGLGGLFVLLGWTMAVLMIIAGRKLKRKISRTFCLAVGGLECLMMPFGTILGIFTIAALTKPSIRELFEPGENSAPKGAAPPV